MVRHKNNRKDDLADIKNRIRKIVLSASYLVGACHIGSALSCVDILVDLYWKRLKKNDIFLFAKASGAAAFYAVLAEKYMKSNRDNESREIAVAYYLKNYPLASKEVPGVIHSVGSLGHGLPVAVGLALSDRSRDVYCLIGDSEVQEGTFWESLLFKRQHKLNNLKIIIDNNGLQACGKIDDILEIPYQITGIEFINTIKGKGVDFMENDYTWHYKNLDEETLKKALAQI